MFLSGIIKFCREEKIYAVLLILVILVYGALFLEKYFAPAEKPSEALREIQEAEEVIKEKSEDPEEIKQFFEKKGISTFAVGSLTLVFLAVLILGIVFDLVFLYNFAYGKENIIRIEREVDASWVFRDVIKVIILFLTAAFLISVALAFIRDFLLGGSLRNFFLLLHTTLADVSLVLIIFYFIVYKYRQRLKALGLNFAHFIKDVVVGIKGYIAALPVFIGIIAVLLFIISLIPYEPEPHALVNVFAEEDKVRPWVIAYSLVLACVIGPIAEEIFFRGFCYPVFKKRVGKWTGIILTGAFFALVHHSTFAFFPVFVLGMILTYVYEKRGSLIPSIVIHVVHNSVFIGYFFLTKRLLLDKI